MIRSRDILNIVFFEICDIIIALLNNGSYTYAYFFWILSIIKMKFGQIRRILRTYRVYIVTFVTQNPCDQNRTYFIGHTGTYLRQGSVYCEISCVREWLAMCFRKKL